MVASIDKTNFKLNVQDLQSDVVDCLEKIVELMERARDILRSDRLFY